jgi:hypothetical protein
MLPPATRARAARPLKRGYRPLGVRRLGQAAEVRQLGSGPVMSGPVMSDPGRRRVQQNLALKPQLPDQVELTVKKVDVFFLIGQDLQQQVAGDEVTRAFAVGDGLTQVVQRLFLQMEVRAQDFLDGLADPDPVEAPEVRQAAVGRRRGAFRAVGGRRQATCGRGASSSGR